MSAELFPPHYFNRIDEDNDALFYTFPRKVVHIDDAAIEAVGRLYGDLLPKNGVLLDLMSSWRSHLLSSLGPKEVVGLGMNAEEMADNPQLTAAIVHDLNRNPNLPFADESFDGTMCAVSVQYIVKPISVFREVNRVLREGAPFVLTFSNRCFPMKAVAVWRGTDDEQHIRIVRAYFEASGGWSDITAENRSPAPGYSDPVYGVWARKIKD